MNVPTLMMKIFALAGVSVPISATPAVVDPGPGEYIEAESRPQIGRPAGVRVVRNVEFARRDASGGTIRLRLDLMIPRGTVPLPLVVFAPGGGFRFAPKAAGPRIRRFVAASGFVVASVEYRTTRQAATFRDGLADVQDAVRFLRSNAGEYGIDGERVGLWGESAGAYLVALAGLVGGDPGLDPERTAQVRAVVDMFGCSDLSRRGEGFDDATVAKIFAPRGTIARWVSGPDAVAVDSDPEALRASNPVLRARRDAPAFLILHGTDDRIVSPIETAILHEALIAAGARSTRYLMRGGGHGEIALKRGEDKYWTTEQVLRLSVDFLRRELSAIRTA